jgi:transcriptional regulator with XRE-family HTH domain
VDERQAYAAVVGQLVARLRQGRMSQAALAAKAGLSQSALSRFEQGQTLPDAYELRRIAMALGQSPEKLVAQIELAFANSAEAARRVSKGSPWENLAAGMIAGLAIIGVAAILDEAANGDRRKK